MADPFEVALAGLRQAIVDLDGDGVPDATYDPVSGAVQRAPDMSGGAPRIPSFGTLSSGNTPAGDVIGNAFGPSAGAAWSRTENVARPIAQTAVNVLAQPITAGNAVVQAIEDPTIANLTNAGVQTGMALFRPGMIAKAGLAGYGAAAAKDLGLFGGTARADDLERRLRSMSPAEVRALQQQVGVSPDGRVGPQTITAVRTHEQRLAAEAAERTRIEAEKARLEQQGQNAVALERARIEAQAEAERKSREQSNVLNLYNEQVQTAERARDAELSRRNRFEDTEVGKVYGKLGIVTPMVAAMGAGGLAKAALGSRAGNAPLMAGVGTGAVAANYPLAHDVLLTPAENPDRRAYEAYARELPPTHPRKQEWTEYARTLPVDNPTREAASREFYDPVKFVERTGIGAIEGLVAGTAGSHALEAVGRAPNALASGLGRVPGRLFQGFYEGMEGANRARAGNINALADAGKAEAKNVLGQAANLRAQAALSQAQRGQERAADLLARSRQQAAEVQSRKGAPAGASGAERLAAPPRLPPPGASSQNPASQPPRLTARQRSSLENEIKQLESQRDFAVSKAQTWTGTLGLDPSDIARQYDMEIAKRLQMLGR